MAKSKLTMFDHLDQLLLDYPDQYLTYQQILEDYQGSPFSKNDTLKGNPNWNSLHDAYKKMKRILKAKGLDFDYRNGRNAQEGFRYPDGVDNPMKEERSEHRKLRAKQLTRLIEKSAGLFPSTWLADLLSGAQTLAREQGNQPVIDFDQNLHLEHLELVPTFFDAIEQGHTTLRFKYRPKYGQEVTEILFRPNYLKEYNQRWFVFGQSMNLERRPLSLNICGLERIVGKVTIACDDEPQPVKPMPASHFRDIVGVTRTNAHKQHIVIAANDAETYYRIHTKRLHHSQHSICPPTDGERGCLYIDVIPNPELDTLLMSFGPNIEILEPQTYREDFRAKVKAMAEMYK